MLEVETSVTTAADHNYDLVGGACRSFIAAELQAGSRRLGRNTSRDTGKRVFTKSQEIYPADVMSLQGMGVKLMPGN